ncbi:hypothetical protein EMIT0P218_10213 [Pseudomonas sp. IT-P218]
METGPRDHTRSPVGAGLPAMEVNDDAGSLTPRGALSFFASKLAPTGFMFIIPLPYRTPFSLPRIHCDPQPRA